MAAYYEAFEQLQHVHLEDSWVLAVRSPSDRQLVFDLDLILTEAHPLYEGPRPDEQYGYRRVTATIAADQVVYSPSGAAPARDANDELDFGHIDSWIVNEDGWSEIVGEWGSARALNATVTLGKLPRRT